MQAPKSLPGRAAGVEGLVALADALGDARVFNLIRRCRTAQQGNNPAGETQTILARRMVNAEMERSEVRRTTARGMVARQLGYSATEIPNFTRILNGRDGLGDRELLDLAKQYGDPPVFDLIRICRDAGGPGREALTILARRMVNTEMERSNVDALTARQTVSVRLGYTPKRDGNSRANFARIVDGGRTPETRPHSSLRKSTR